MQELVDKQISTYLFHQKGIKVLFFEVLVLYHSLQAPLLSPIPWHDILYCSVLYYTYISLHYNYTSGLYTILYYTIQYCLVVHRHRALEGMVWIMMRVWMSGVFCKHYGNTAEISLVSLLWSGSSVLHRSHSSLSSAPPASLVPHLIWPLGLWK